MLLALSVLMVCPQVYPGADWPSATPESQGLDPVKLQAAVDYLKANAPFDGVNELFIVRNGHVVWKGPNVDKRHGVWSCTKSFTSTVLGLLVEDGRLTLDAKAAAKVPSLSSTYPNVTYRHFTTMTSGYFAVGDTYTSHGQSGTPFNPSTTPLFTPPGSKYAYWDSAMNQLGNALTQAAGEPMEALFKRRIADPIGIPSTAWDWGDWGTINGLVVNGGSGNGNRQIHITARQMARFGWLYLHRGRWNGTQLISAAWVDAATAPQVPSTTPLGHAGASPIDGPGVYGFNWWVNGIKSDGRRKWPGAPASTFSASGHNNNDMFVIRDWNMVIVRLGLDEGGTGAFKIPDSTYSTFLQKVGQSIGVAPPPSGPAVTALTLMNADTDQPIGALADGAALNLSTLPTRNLNVRAGTSPTTVGSVRFGYDGNPAYRTENAAPYAFAGDSSGNYNPWTPSTGSHTITATAYTGSNATGTAGTPLKVSFTVVVGTTNQPPSVSISSPADGATYSAGSTITIVATASDPDGSVAFVDFYRGTTHLGMDASAPYGVAWSNAAAGTYTLTARATDNATATRTSVPITVTVLSPTGPSVSGFVLVNADTDGDIGPLASGATLNLATLPTRRLNIRANTSPSTVGSVRFGLDADPYLRVENAAPYALQGDTSGNYAAWTPALGSHSVSATPYTLSGATGTAGATKTVTFTVVDSAAAARTDVLPAGTPSSPDDSPSCGLLGPEIVFLALVLALKKAIGNRP